jgi:hypothetical protein
MHNISVTFITKIVQGNEDAGDDAAALQWVNIEDELDGLIQSQKIAFDHSKILNDYKKWMKATQSSVESGYLTFWSTKKEKTDQAMPIKPTEG